MERLIFYNGDVLYVFLKMIFLIYNDIINILSVIVVLYDDIYVLED